MPWPTLRDLNADWPEPQGPSRPVALPTGRSRVRLWSTSLSRLLGLMIAAEILAVGPVAAASVDQLAELVTPALEGYPG